MQIRGVAVGRRAAALVASFVRGAPPLWAQFIVFCTVGLTNTAVDAGVFVALVMLLDWRDGVEPLVASTLGFIAGALNSFAWNSRVTFRSRSERPPLVVGRFVVAIAAGAVTAGVAFTVVRAAWADATTVLAASKAAAIAVGTAWNFSLMRWWVFPARGEPADAERRWYASRPLAVLLLAAVIVRVPFLFMPGYWWDIELFQRWASTAAQQGLVAALVRPDMDYVGYNYVLGGLGFAYLHVAQPVDLASDAAFRQVLKLPALVGDLGTIVLLYLVGLRLASMNATRLPWMGRVAWLRTLPPEQQAGLAIAAVYAFNPAVLYDTVYWGQVDSLITLGMVTAVLVLAHGKPAVAGLVFGLAFLVKPQPVLLTPLLLWLALRWHGMRGLLAGVGATLLTIALGLSYWVAAGQFGKVRAIYRTLFESGDQVSVSAWNGWWIAYRLHESVRPSDVVSLGGLAVTIEDVSRVLLAGAVLIACAYAGPRPTLARALLAAAFMAFTFFMLPMKMHERYLFPLLALLAPAAAFSGRWAAMYVALSVMFVLNLYALFPFPPVVRPEGTHRFIGAPADAYLSAVNVLLFVVFAAALAAAAVREWVRWLRSSPFAPGGRRVAEDEAAPATSRAASARSASGEG